MKKKSVYFKNLDTIRFIAAMIVFLSHTVKSISHFDNINNWELKHFLLTISNGGTGVSIFFVLSGFLITYLLIAEYEYHACIKIGNFYMRRILRIWPIYFAAVLCAFSLYPLFQVPPYFQYNIFYHLGFLSNFDVLKGGHSTNVHLDAQSVQVFWSVAVEEQFYLFWPLIFAFLPKRYWIHAIVSVILASLSFRIIYRDDAIILYFHTLAVLLYLAMGGLFAYLVIRYDRVKAFFEKTDTLGHIFYLSLTAAMLLATDHAVLYEYGRAIAPFFTSISFALVITAQAMTKTDSILNFKNFTFADRWGKYTYGIYLIHTLVILLVIHAAAAMGLPAEGYFNIAIISIISFIITLPVSKLSYIYFEARFLKLKDKFAIIHSEPVVTDK